MTPHIIRMFLPSPTYSLPLPLRYLVQPCSTVLSKCSWGSILHHLAKRCDAVVTWWSTNGICRSCQSLIQKGDVVHVLDAREFREGKSWIIYAFCFTALSEALLILSCLFFSLLWQHLVISSQCLREGKGNEVFSMKIDHSSQSGLYKLLFMESKPIGLRYWEYCLQQMLL